MRDINKKESHSTRTQIYSEVTAKRVTYYVGQILTADLLREEQAYFLEKLRQHNRATLDVGIIKGLDVTCVNNMVSINKGFAMDTIGRIIELTTSCCIEIPEEDGIWDVFICYEEEIVEEPLPEWDAWTNQKDYKCVQEGVGVSIGKVPNTDDIDKTEESILLGRVIKKRGICQVAEISSVI